MIIKATFGAPEWNERNKNPDASIKIIIYKFFSVTGLVRRVQLLEIYISMIDRQIVQDPKDRLRFNITSTFQKALI